MLERKQYIHSTPSHIPNWTCQKKAQMQLFSYFKRHHPSLHVHRFTHQPTTELRSIDSFRASLMALLMTEDEEDASREGLFRPRPPSARSRIRKPNWQVFTQNGGFLDSPYLFRVMSHANVQQLSWHSTTKSTLKPPILAKVSVLKHEKPFCNWR